MSTAAELLERHRPFLKYDSHEVYFADSAAEWTDNPGNALLGDRGEEIAAAGGALSLAFLGASYPGGRRAKKTDRIGDRTRDYAEQARALHAKPEYANRIYGHAAHDAGGDMWLQYWFFYFYNDYNLIGQFIKAGLHEGDWEMIQIHLSDERPDFAVYAQHNLAEGRDWRQVDMLPGTRRPIVYVARGSHASYFEPGTQWTGQWFDHADGRRRSPEARLEIADESLRDFHWLRWPGRWGDTRSAGGPLDSDSPVGPAMHPQWRDPLKLASEARAQARVAARAEGPPPVPPAPPRIVAEWHRGTIRLRYEVFASQPGRWPDGLLVTLNSPDDTAPPVAERFAIDAHQGAVDVGTAVDPAHRYDLFASAATPDGLASESVRVDLAPQPSAR
jgi:hypothetical protein